MQLKDVLVGNDCIFIGIYILILACFAYFNRTLSKSQVSCMSIQNPC